MDFYNGVTAEQIQSGASPIGIEAWSNQGIVGRGVLIDFASYAKRHSITGYDAAARPEISLELIKAVASESGFVAACQNKSFAEQEIISHQSPGQYPGVSGSPEMAAWLWDS
ncbi:hypothetical protein SCUCBS95973_002341 [Sporothrix curviconia]|uniref:Uncharacterized protein n=1 Tax=Sporothrix curviconia TaxID=1260050 RepID=A0ABP0B6D6_9PEZI